jgi:argininosuccinate lyase
VDGVTAVLRALAAQARAGLAVALPFYTHLQRAQPVLLAHHWLAHAEAFRRDRERLRDCLRRADVCPLGAGAGAGTTFPIDPAHTAAGLGFSAPLRNSLDAVAARDHVLEFAGAAAIAAIHCSRLGEELVLWTSAEFGFARMPDAFASSSSIMPQKRNADAAELARAVAGRVIGRFAGFAATLKGLPLAYNKDLQETTAVLLEVGDAMARLLPAVAGMVAGLQVDGARLRAAAEDPRGYLLATDLADHLVRQGLPFREAHGQVAALVRWCEGAGKGLGACTRAEIHAHCPKAADDIASRLTIEAALAARAHLGGTAPARVRDAVAALERELA